jgi:hypothetical protein
MVGVRRAPCLIDATAALGLVEPELIGGHLDVARATQVLGVVVLITATMGQGDDMVDPFSQPRVGRRPTGPAVDAQASLAKAIRALQPALALRLPCAAALALNRCRGQG